MPQFPTVRLDRQRRWTTTCGYAAAVLAGAIVGLYWVLQSYTLDLGVIGPAELNWLNIMVVALIVWPLVWVRSAGAILPPGTPVGWLVLFALNAAAIFYLRNLGVSRCGATTASVVMTVELLLVFVLTYAVLRQRVAAWGWVGAVLLVAGVLRVAGVGSAQMHLLTTGIVALVVAAVCLAGNALIIKTQFQRVPNTLVILFSATTQTLVFAVVVSSLVGLDGVREVFRRPQLLLLVALGGLSIFTSLFLYYYAMKRVPMWAVRILALTGPPTAMLGDHFLLGSPITAPAVQGLAAVLVGATLVIISGQEDGAAAANNALCSGQR